ncbi:hypothetical protein STCU_04579 [Strigomonas culicis]|nr:hypothetical protein STCU_09639 [Strigomonas culicis]EPY29392.1 hypothetical protein STCU_04579 [Strigomonas culicis]|eukprot:EPY19072.1 hypothetical protein STCU_09639 [Strigomonas culicis]
MNIIVKLKVDSSTVLTHVALVRLLLTLTSTALHHSTKFIKTEIDIFTEMIMSSHSLQSLVETLLQRVITWGTDAVPATPTFYAEGHQPSLLNLYNMFGSKAPRDNTDAVEQAHGLFVYHSCSCFDVLGRLCVNLLCVLVAHQKGNGKNPALDVIRQLQDTPSVQRGQLLKAVAARLVACPTLCMLLYTLLYDNRDFLPHIVAQEKAALVGVTQQLLELHYRVCTETDTGGRGASKAVATADGAAAVRDPLDEGALQRMVKESLQFSYAFINFMTSTLLLILSQNLEVSIILCDTDVVPQIKKDRPLGKMKAGAFALHVFCFSIARALGDHNEILTSVLAPCMSNIAASLHDVDAKTSQRILSLLTSMLKKIIRIDATLQPVVAAPSIGDGGLPLSEMASASASVTDVGDAVAQKALGDMYVRQLQMLVETIEGMLRGDDRHNESLAYELIYNRAVIIDAFADRALGPVAAQAAPILSNLATVIRNHEAIIATLPQDGQTPEGIMKLIRHAKNAESEEMQEVRVKQSHSGIAYTYEESAQSYDFFGPYVWGTQLHNAQRPGAPLWCRTPRELLLFPK